MPILLLIAGLAAIGGTTAFGYESGQEAGEGLNQGLTIVGIATGVGIIIYALHKSGHKV